MPLRLYRPLWAALTLVVCACGSGAPLVSSEDPLSPGDSLTPPIDTGAPAPPPPPDTSTPPPAPPPPAPAPPPPSAPPIHAGIPFGPTVYTKSQSSFSLLPPSTLDQAFNALLTDAHLPILLAKLEAARQSNGRVLLGFAGSPVKVRDANGFSITKWKQRVDQFRGLDLSSYIADGTLMGHFLMDEPGDPSNWNGHEVSLADIDEMARYSKEIWPDLPAIIRAWPAELKGYDFQYLDAGWAQYHSRFGPIDAFIANNVRDAKANGLALVLGLNVVAGGTDPGMHGYHYNRLAMTASQVRSWGNILLDEPHVCAFFMFRYNGDYFARADIQEAVAELSRKAAGLANRPCRRS